MAADPGRAQRADRGADRLGQDARRVSRGDRRSGARRRGDAPVCRTRRASSTSRRSRRSRTTSRRTSQRPLAGIRDELEAMGLPDVEIRTLVRTGDTPQAERAGMRKRPPHIVVTTPESLYILLAERGRPQDARRPTRTVIVDEIHALVGDKRGSHLALSLERLEALTPTRAGQRIGLSATQKPIEEVARFLVGARRERATSADCTIVDAGPRPRARPRHRGAAVAARGGDVARGVGRDLRAPRRARAHAPHDARLRQHAPHGRARGAAPVASGSARSTSPRTTAASRRSSGSTPSSG